MRPIRANPQTALTLTETIFALFLVGTVLVLLFNLFPTSVVALRSAEARNRAHRIADGIITRQMSLPYSQLVVSGPTPLTPVSSGGVTFQPALEVFQLPGRNPLYLRGVRVVVRWENGNKPQEIRQEVWVPNARR